MKVIINPSKYIQGANVLNELETLSAPLGEKLFVIATSGSIKRSKSALVASFKNQENLYFEEFNKECSKNEVERLQAKVESAKCDVIVGFGGGKTLDTAKAVAFYCKKPVIIIPTIASTDAPCSALSVLYTDEGEFSEYLFLPHSPELVMVDTAIVAKAPARLLVAGMGDALATYFEARACERSEATSCAGGTSTKAAMALAELCFDTLIADGLKAKLSVEKGVASKATENIIEANTYLSGIGFESGGLAGAHAIHNGLTVLDQCHHMYHGEKVAFGTICQLMLENESSELLDEVISFCIELGLPVTLEELGLKDVSKEDLMKVAAASAVEGETIHNMPFKVTPDDVFAAILATDSYGSNLKNQLS